ncbi:MAG: ribonuclease Z [Chlamydiae bacterium RIFCSPHIGHO2_12_FULL_49_11]|nr:MAG: ribonuclease Z [Chlamydiae bacterium RIFCSPHIGHO2_12_FULL_49_11]
MTVRDLIILGTSSQQPTRRRNHGGYLLRWNEEGFLFDPGEGTQRQFIFADVTPTTVTRMFVSHFHGDHCLGVGSMLMRLNLDKVTHPVHCFFPAAGQEYFHRLRHGTIYHQNIEIIEHPIRGEGVFYEDDKFTYEAYYLSHGTTCLAYRIKEKDERKFDKEKLARLGIRGMLMKELLLEGQIRHEGALITLDHVSHIRTGDIFSIIMDTRPCPGAERAAKGATLLLCESTYLDVHKDLAYHHRHLTATEAALIAKQAEAKKLVLTHFSARYLDAGDFRKEAHPIFPNVHAAEDLDVIDFRKST